VFRAENRNKFSRVVLAQNLGYSGINGRALAKIGAVRAYGLIEGSGDDLRLSEDAIIALNAPRESEEWQSSMRRLAMKPALFQELSQEFQSLPSDNNLRFWLIKRHYTPDAAAKAAATYLETMQLVSGASGEYVTPEVQEADDMQQAGPQEARPTGWLARAAKLGKSSGPGMLEETFNLDEGPVTITFPAAISTESFADLSDQLQLFLRRAKRRSAARKDGEDEDN
jgi:hypothetical protein